MVGAAAGLGDDMVNLQMAELKSGAAAPAASLLMPKQDMLVLPIRTRRVNVGAAGYVGAGRYQTVVKQVAH